MVADIARSERRHVHVDVDDDGGSDVGQVDEVRGEVDGQAAEGNDRGKRLADALPGFGGRSLRRWLSGLPRARCPPGLEVAPARPRDQVRAGGQPHLDAAEAARAPRRDRLVGQQVVDLVVVQDPLQSLSDVVVVQDGEPARVLRQRPASPRDGSRPGRSRRASGPRRVRRTPLGDVSRRGGHREPAGVERVHRGAGPRGRVGDPAQVVGALGQRPPPQEEPLGEEEHDLAAGHRRQASHGRLDHGQGGPRVARALVEDASHPLPHHRDCGIATDPELVHELGHRELERLVARRRELAEALDLLGLLLADVGGAEAHAGAAVLQGDAIHGTHQRAAVAGQRLKHAPDAAGRHQGHLVPGPHLLQEESGRFAFRGSQSGSPPGGGRRTPGRSCGRRQATRPRAGCGRRRGRGGRPSRAGSGPRGRADREVGDRLRAPVLQDLEVLAPQVAHGHAVSPGHHHVDLDELSRRRERRHRRVLPASAGDRGRGRDRDGGEGERQRRGQPACPHRLSLRGFKIRRSGSQST